MSDRRAALVLRFDLQSHSTRSDGALEPAEVVAAAAAAGVQLLALTDHDTVDGVPEALRAGERHGVRVVPAAELSSIDELGEDLHVLGYGLDPADPSLAASLAAWRADRVARIDRMADALEELGLAVDRAAFAHLDAPGRPHLAAATWGAPENAERVRAEGLGSPGALLEAYLLPGGPAWRRRTRPTVAEAVDAIHAAGGVAVWAHPFWDVDDPAEVEAALRRFAALGVDGVEAFYPTHGAEQVALLDRLARELDLLTTGSSDFHGPRHGTFGGFLGFSLHGFAPRLGPIAA